MVKAWIRGPPPRGCIWTRFANAGAHGVLDTVRGCTGAANEREEETLARVATDVFEVPTDMSILRGCSGK